MTNQNKKNSNLDIVSSIIEEVSSEMSNEEIVELLLSHRMANIDHHQEPLKLADKTADSLARFAGSWKFIILFSIIIALWMTYNVLTKVAFDPYPFILLNLLLSSIAALQAPVIMMSQNRQSDVDRKQAENDYRVNLKSEIIVETIYQQLQEILANQQKILTKIDQSANEKQDQ